MTQQSTMTPQKARKALWVLSGFALAVVLLVIGFLVYGLVHPLEHKALFMLIGMVFGPAPLTFLLSKAGLRGMLERDSLIDPASFFSVLQRNPMILFLLPLMIMAITWGFLLVIVGMKKGGDAKAWMKGHTVLTIFWLTVPQLITAYLCIIMQARYVGIGIAACIVYNTAMVAISGLTLENGVTKFFGTYKAQASPLVILSLALMCCASFGVLHYAVSLIWSNEYGNMHGIEDALYFSVVTMATVGYGDILPIGHIARWLCVAEIMSGVLLLVVGVSASMTIWLQNNQPSLADRPDSPVSAPTVQGGVTSEPDSSSHL